MILEKILASVRRDLELKKQNQPQAVLCRQIEALPATRGFQKALAVPGQVQLIAEFKQASPSKGIIRQDLAPEAVFSAYAANGAAAISILTEPDFFKGSVSYLSQARQITGIPLLRKDFIVDEYQLFEARAYGADAVLLIVAALSGQQLGRLLQQAQALSLDCLVEAHTKTEIAVAIASGAQIIGINNRNLATFETRLETTFELVRHIPQGRILVSESGINTRADIARLAESGVNAVLVGEALMRSASPGQKLRELAGDRH
jgi:indole-3-glycerol phosphate synthase